MRMQDGPCCSTETTTTAAYIDYICCHCCGLQVLTPPVAVLLEPRPAGLAPLASSLAPWRCSSSSTQWQRTHGVAARQQLLQPSIPSRLCCTHSHVQLLTNAQQELAVRSNLAALGLWLPFGTQAAFPPDLASTVSSTQLELGCGPVVVRSKSHLTISISSTEPRHAVSTSRQYGPSCTACSRCSSVISSARLACACRILYSREHEPGT